MSLKKFKITITSLMVLFMSLPAMINAEIKKPSDFVGLCAGSDRKCYD